MKILTDLPELSGAELAVYKYVVANIRLVSKMSISELATRSNTSTATVLRMCRKYGCSGFSQFKYKLHEELNSSEDFDSPLAAYNQGIYHFFNTTAKSSAFNEQLQKAAEILSTKHFILFAGLGSSNIISEYGSLYFSYLFNLSFRVEDITNYPVDFFPSALAKDICLIICSVSGDTEEVIQYARNYHTGDAALICITSNGASNLAAIADAEIVYNLPITMKGTSNLTSQIPAMYIIEKLAAMMAKMRKENH